MIRVFTRNPNSFIEEIKDERLRLLRELAMMPVTDPGYDNAVRQLSIIEDILNAEHSKHNITPSSLLSALVSVSSIMLILQHEKLNVISSKALGFVKRTTA